MIILVNKDNPNAVAEFLEKNPSYVVVNETITVDGTEFQLEEAIGFTM